MKHSCSAKMITQFPHHSGRDVVVCNNSRTSGSVCSTTLQFGYGHKTADGQRLTTPTQLLRAEKLTVMGPWFFFFFFLQLTATAHWF